MEPQRRDIIELTRVMTKLGLTLADTNKSLEAVLAKLKERDEEENK